MLEIPKLPEANPAQKLLQKFETQADFSLLTALLVDKILRENLGYKEKDDLGRVTPGRLSSEARRIIDAHLLPQQEDLSSLMSEIKASRRLVDAYCEANPQLNPTKTKDNQVLALAMLTHLQNPSQHQEIYDRKEMVMPKSCYFFEAPLGLVFVIDDSEAISSLSGQNKEQGTPDKLSNQNKGGGSIGGVSIAKGIMLYAFTQNKKPLGITVIKGYALGTDELCFSSRILQHEENHWIDSLAAGGRSTNIYKALNFNTASREAQVKGMTEATTESVITEILSYFIDGRDKNDFLSIMTAKEGLYNYPGIDVGSLEYRKLLEEGFDNLTNLWELYVDRNKFYFRNYEEYRLAHFYVTGLVAGLTISQWDRVLDLKKKQLHG